MFDFKVVAVSANAAAPGSRSGRRKQHLELARRLRAVSGAASARDAANELAAITCVEELEIDYEEVLGVKRGDLAIIQGEVSSLLPSSSPSLSLVFVAVPVFLCSVSLCVCVPRTSSVSPSSWSVLLCLSTYV